MSDGPRADRLWDEGQRLLGEWHIEEARATFEILATEERSAEVLEELSLCLELEGDLAGADRLLEEAAQLDPDRAPLPPRLGAADFQGVIAEAVAGLPAPQRRALERTRVVTEPMPFRELVPPDDPQATPPDLLGLFVGPTIHDLAEDLSAELPPTIYLFQRNLERSCRDRDQLEHEIRTTLLHELGHLLGLDEDQVEDLGLG